MHLSKRNMTGNNTYIVGPLKLVKAKPSGHPVLFPSQLAKANAILHTLFLQAQQQAEKR